MKKDKITFSSIIGYPERKTGAGPFVCLLTIMVALCVIMHMYLY